MYEKYIPGHTTAPREFMLEKLARAFLNALI